MIFKEKQLKQFFSTAFSFLNRLLSITNKNSGNAVITSNSFIYDANDLIGTETATNNDAMTGFQQGVQTYNYNNLNQLLQVTKNQGPETTILTYDASGNMTKGYTPQGFEFQAAYDAENRLKSIQYTDSASVVHKTEYIHGANGFVGIIKQYENGALIKETRMVRDGFLEIQERNQNNAITREYAWGLNLGGGIGGLLALKQNGQNYHYLYDGKGNVSAVLDAAQQIVASYRYDTFGRLMVKSGTLDQPFQFSTKYYDQNTGLNNFGYRHYSAALGRWINRDPLGEAGGVNLYGFVGNNPANSVDPLGLKHWSPGLGMYLPDPGDELADKCPRGPKPDPCAPLLPPDIPPGADADQNMLTSEGMKDPVWFYNQVRNKGPWDYKQQGPQYQPFGNFNFGSAGMAVGLSPQILQRGAGWGQGRAGTSSPGWGRWWWRYPYGDDPADQYWIMQGIAYYKCRKMTP